MRCWLVGLIQHVDMPMQPCLPLPIPPVLVDQMDFVVCLFLITTCFVHHYSSFIVSFTNLCLGWSKRHAYANKFFLNHDQLLIFNFFFILMIPLFLILVTGCISSYGDHNTYYLEEIELYILIYNLQNNNRSPWCTRILFKLHLVDFVMRTY